MSSHPTSPSVVQDALLASDRWRDLAAAWLASGDPPPVPPDIDAVAFAATADAHGVTGLLHARIAATAASQWPTAVVEKLRAGAHRQAARELVQRGELQRLVAAVAARGIDMLLMKGAALAYDVYADPAWRVRSDVDMLIRESDCAAMRDCLRSLGYDCVSEVSGGLVAYQFHAERVDGARIRHLCDVHWKIANPQRFASAVDFAELAGDAIALRLVGPDARGLGRAHALWLACVHRAAHHYDQDTLAWLYDVHLLVEALDAAGIARFVALARRSDVRRICRRAVRLVHALFKTAVPPALLAGLDDGSEREESALFLRRDLRRVDILVDDLRALDGWKKRLRLVGEVLFPPSAYMRSVYAPGSSAPVAWLYARRIVGGASRWLRRAPAPTARR